MTISNAEVQALVEKIIQPGVGNEGKAALLRHLDAGDQMLVLAVTIDIATRQRDMYRNIADLMRAIIHRVKDKPAGLLPDLYQIALDGCGGDIVKAIEGVKSGELMLVVLPTEHTEH